MDYDKEYRVDVRKSGGKLEVNFIFSQGEHSTFYVDLPLHQARVEGLEMIIDHNCPDKVLRQAMKDELHAELLGYPII
jgi:uncharacterized protein YxeA